MSALARKTIYSVLLLCFYWQCWSQLDSLKINDYKNRIQDQDVFIKLNPSNSLALSKRAFYKEKIGDLDGSVEDYTKAIEYLPLEVTNYYYRGLTLTEMNLYQKAILDFSKALVMRPDLLYILLDRGQAYSTLSQFDKALKDFESFQKLTPTDPRGFYYRAETKLRQKDSIGAFEDYNKSILIDRTFEMAYYGRGSLYIVLKKDLEKAMQDYNTAIKLNPENYINYAGRAYVYMIKRDFKKAIKDYEKSIGLYPGFDMGIFNLAGVYFDNGDSKKSLELYTKFIEMHPAEARGYLGRASIYEAIKETDKAEQDYLMAEKYKSNEQN